MGKRGSSLPAVEWEMAAGKDADLAQLAEIPSVNWRGGKKNNAGDRLHPVISGPDVSLNTCWIAVAMREIISSRRFRKTKESL